jgi:hypothetical protein
MARCRDAVRYRSPVRAVVMLRVVVVVVVTGMR